MLDSRYKILRQVIIFLFGEMFWPSKVSDIYREGILSNKLWEVGEVKKKHIKTVVKGSLRKPHLKDGCGECQVSCQSACKTSCTVGNQACSINK